MTVAVDSAADPLVADFVGLRDQWRTQGSGYFVAEGVLVIRQLLRSPYPLRSMLVTEKGLRDLEGDLPAGCVVGLAPEAVIRQIAGFDFHRGALASADRLPLPDLLTVVAGAGLVLAVEGVNDHENLGGLFRSAAGFGVSALVLDPTSCDPLYRRSVRVSMGHALRVPFTRATEWPADLRALQVAGFEVIALTPGGEIELRDLRPGARQVLLVGAEGAGLSQPAMGAADVRARIAMAPGVDSLNVATAAAIALHHLRP